MKNKNYHVPPLERLRYYCDAGCRIMKALVYVKHDGTPDHLGYDLIKLRAPQEYVRYYADSISDIMKHLASTATEEIVYGEVKVGNVELIKKAIADITHRMDAGLCGMEYVLDGNEECNERRQRKIAEDLSEFYRETVEFLKPYKSAIMLYALYLISNESESNEPIPYEVGEMLDKISLSIASN